MSAVFQPIAPRAAPIKMEGLVPWVRHNLFGGWRNTIATIIGLAVIVYWLPSLANWLAFKAVFAADSDVCQEARGLGACWGVVTEKHRLIIFGRYPFAEQWRPLVATILLMGLLIASCVRALWKPWLGLLWLAVRGLFFSLMGGGVAGARPRAARPRGRMAPPAEV